MSVKTSSCVWVECDGDRCDRDKGWPDEGPFHFDSEQAVLEYVLGENGPGWTRLPDGAAAVPRLLAGRRLQDHRVPVERVAPRLQERTARPEHRAPVVHPLRRRVRGTPHQDGRAGMNRSEITGPAPLGTPEVSPSSLWCQRWTGRQHSWRHTSEGGFDPSRYIVEPISEADARTWVIRQTVWTVTIERGLGPPGIPDLARRGDGRLQSRTRSSRPRQ